MGVRIGLVGDHDPSVTAHRAIPRALDLVGADGEWIGTETIRNVDRLGGFDGIWCVPKTPYRNTEGALLAVRHARESGVPFLGTCGGFQHAVLEYARNVLGWEDAGHAEVDGGGRLVIAPLTCSLVEVTGEVRLLAGTRIGSAYRTDHAIEGYHCSFGLNPEFREALASGPLRVSAEDGEGSVRALELDGHPFFVITLFQPERAALEGRVPPIVRAFAEACAGERRIA